MDNLFVSLANLGGGFIISAVVLILHRDALVAFREELLAERAANNENTKAEREQCQRNHQQLMATLADHHKDVAVALGVRKQMGKT